MEKPVKKVAIIDIGSNSIQLAIYNIYNPNINKLVKRVKETVRLINYLDSKGNLTIDGIKLVITTLKNFRKVINFYEVNDINCFGTAALRQSMNQAEVLKKIRKYTTYSVTILSEYEEAYFGYLGVSQSMVDLKEGITLDIGGGSTEVALFKGKEIVQFHSFPFGAVTLNEKFTNGDVVSKDQILQLCTYLYSQFESLTWLGEISYPVIGIGGSAKNLSRINELSSKRNQQHYLKHKRVEFIFGELCSLEAKQRQKIKGLSRRRKDIIIPAVKTIAVMMDIANSPYFIYSDKTVRDGFLYDKFSKKDLISSSITS